MRQRTVLVCCCFHFSAVGDRAFPFAGLPVWNALSLSLRFNGHFPGGPGLAGTRMSSFWMWRQLELQDVLCSSQAVTTTKPTPTFLQA